MGNSAKGLYLLFAQGKRPDRAAVRAFAERHSEIVISHDPEPDERPAIGVVCEECGCSNHSDQVPSDTTFWLEILRGGLTFDLRGLAPGKSSTFPEPEFRIDTQTLPKPEDFEAIQLLPSKHLAGGERSLPLAKALLQTARDLAQHFDGVEAIIWPPAANAIGIRFFESVVTAWIEGGPFPALALVSFTETADEALQTLGLDFWIDQELRLEMPLSAETVSATRLGVRLINHLITVGGLESDERIVAPDGNRLVLRLSRNSRFIRVLRE